MLRAALASLSELLPDKSHMKDFVRSGGIELLAQQLSPSTDEDINKSVVLLLSTISAWDPVHRDRVLASGCLASAETVREIVYFVYTI